MGDEVAVILKREHPMLLRISDGYIHKGEEPAVLLDVIEHVLRFRAKPMNPPGCSEG
jgi:hypothetical protein